MSIWTNKISPSTRINPEMNQKNSKSIHDMQKYKCDFCCNIKLFRQAQYISQDYTK